MISIVPGSEEYKAGFEALVAEVFADYADLVRLLGKFYSTQGVHTFLAIDPIRRAPVGFAMLGFLPWGGGDDERDWWLADLLGLGVATAHRRRGLGRKLMARVDEVIGEMAEWRDLKACQLTCPADDETALAFFRAQGFTVLDQHHGTYAGGQVAWRLARDIPPA